MASRPQSSVTRGRKGESPAGADAESVARGELLGGGRGGAKATVTIKRATFILAESGTEKLHVSDHLEMDAIMASFQILAVPKDPHVVRFIIKS